MSCRGATWVLVAPSREKPVKNGSKSVVGNSLQINRKHRCNKGYNQSQIHPCSDDGLEKG
ncbi:hypothetical protein NBRC116587_29640 [Pseudoteredinibacter isoporae]